MRHYDVIIIGSGPAGEGAAMRLAKAGRRVAVIEQHTEVGGGCTHWGTIPSKALRHAVQMLTDYRASPLFRGAMTHLRPDYPQLLRAARTVIDKQVAMRHRFYSRNGVDLIAGRARFADAGTVEITEPAGPGEACRADSVIIATGSRPYHPPDVDFGHPNIRDSDTVLQLHDRDPRSISIYGAGVIGCEYASIYAHMGLKVDLIDTRDRLLSFLDDEITDALSYHLRELGVIIRHNEEYDRVEARDEGVIVHCRSGKRIRNELLLWANGRSGNTRDLGLEELGITLNHRDQVEVNDCYQTTQSHIYAVGDVVGPPALASASYDQGRFVGTHIVEGRADERLLKDIPTGIYTSPEISSVGRTERELTAERVPYEVGRAMFRSIARAQITGHTVGMVKLLFHTETLELLGIHCFGQQAAEIVHIGQAIMSQPPPGNTVRYFVDTTFNYPTMAEAYRVAALNGLNRLNRLE